MTVTISGTGGVTLPDSFVLAGESSLPQVTTASVLSATSGASVGAVGTYAWLGLLTGNTTISVGSQVAGSALAYSGATTINNATSLASWFTGTFNAGGSPSGTWLAVGHSVPYPATNISAQTLFLRIA